MGIRKSRSRFILASSVVAVLAACVGYQPEPYAEFQYRDESFEPDGPHTYTGSTYMVGMRYAAPTIIAAGSLPRGSSEGTVNAAAERIRSLNKEVADERAKCAKLEGELNAAKREVSDSAAHLDAEHGKVDKLKADLAEAQSWSWVTKMEWTPGTILALLILVAGAIIGLRYYVKIRGGKPKPE